MASSSFQRLIRVLELEEKQGWRNRAVIGGLQSMAKRWRLDAEAETAEQQVVDAIVRLMEEFEGAEPASRLHIAESIRRALDGDLRGHTSDPEVQTRSSGPVPAETGGPAGGFMEVDIPPPEPTHVAQERAQRAKPAPARNPEDLHASPGILKGVGRTTIQQLERLGIRELIDLVVASSISAR